MTAMFSLPDLERFHIVDGLAHLSPVEPSVCPTCNCFMQEKSEVVVDVDECTIITLTQCFPAIQYKRICHQCHSTLLFDGSECGLLNFGKFLVALEVFRHFMYSFLGGRYKTMFVVYIL